MLELAEKIQFNSATTNQGISIITYPAHYYSLFPELTSHLHLAFNEVTYGQSSVLTNPTVTTLSSNIEIIPYFKQKVLDAAITADNIFELYTQVSVNNDAKQNFAADYQVSFEEFQNFLSRYITLRQDLINDYTTIIDRVPQYMHNLIYEIICVHMLDKYSNQDWQNRQLNVILPEYLFGYIRNRNPQCNLLSAAYNTLGVFHLDQKFRISNSFISVPGLRRGSMIEFLTRYQPLLAVL